jgi:hypothetical protein
MPSLLQVPSMPKAEPKSGGGSILGREIPLQLLGLQNAVDISSADWYTSVCEQYGWLPMKWNPS